MDQKGFNFVLKEKVKDKAIETKFKKRIYHNCFENGYKSFVIIPIDVNKLEIDSESVLKPADDLKCFPPPWFIITLSFLQALFFFHYIFLEEFGAKHDLLERLLEYRPDFTYHLWRYGLYSLFHIGWLHLLFNLSVQITLGLPLEMLHGPLRVACIYCSGVVAGAVTCRVLNSQVVLLGSSGGVYALLAAHLADVVLNYSYMELGRLKLIGITWIAVLDVLLSLRDEYGGGLDSNISMSENSPRGECANTVSYTAHFAGAVVGLMVALALLRTHSSKTSLILIQKTCFYLLIMFTCMICMYLFYVKYPPFL